MSSSYPTRNNPFEDTNREPTDEEFLRSKILDIQQESRGSTQRSLALLMQSEEVATGTAQQLVEQGERLEKIEGKVVKIDSDLKQSQRHINGLKSVFGGITNWWSQKKGKKSNEEPVGSGSSDGIRAAMKKSSSEHSTLSTRQHPPYSQTAGTSINTVIEQNELDIDDDLDQMSVLTQNLKSMAFAMGNELDRHNAQIDRINDKVGRTDMTMSGQNKQMNKILGK